MNICDHGCGQEAKYYSQQTKKWRCSKWPSSCPELRRKDSESHKKPKPDLKLCECGCGNFAKPGKRFIHWHHTRGKKRLDLAGKKRPDHSIKMTGEGNPRFGQPGYWRDKNRPEFSGENHPNWQGGVSFEPYSPKFNKQFKTIIRERDNYTCQLCGEYGNFVHHIDYNKENTNPNNALTLCNPDNSKVNFNRDQWETYFRLYLLIKKN